MSAAECWMACGVEVTAVHDVKVVMRGRRSGGACYKGCWWIGGLVARIM